MSVFDSIASLGTVKARRLHEEEKAPQCARDSLPIVIEPVGTRGVNELFDLLSKHSDTFKAALFESGALLFRGFAIQQEAEFEKLVLSLKPKQPMPSYFWCEPGRDRIEGCDYVFHTNTLFKTGGDLKLGYFHSENFFNTDMPSMMSFFCKVAPSVGGETGLIYTPAVYESLPESVQRKLRDKSVIACMIGLDSIASRYNVTEAMFEEFARANGLLIETIKGKKQLILHKPVLFEHPKTGRIGFQISYLVEGQAADRTLRAMLAKTYPWPGWFKHRLSWIGSNLQSHLFEFFLARGFVRERMFGHRSAELSLEQRLTPAEWKEVGRAMRKNLVSFRWQKGDVLVFDNLQLLHGGMPGSGERCIRVLMCDPVPLDHARRSGIATPQDYLPSHETIATRLEQFITDYKKTNPKGAA